jgi:hypothetical protein
LGEGIVALSFQQSGAGRYGETVQRRLDALGRAMGRRTDARGV